MYLDNVPIDYRVVLVSAIVYFIIGTIWYAPFAFGKRWGLCQEKKGIYGEKLETGCKVECISRTIGAYVAEFIIAFIIAYVLALFIEVSQAKEILEGMAVALWAWIGFIATTHFSAVLWGRKTLEHFFIHAGFMLVGLIAMSLVFMYVGF